MPRTPKSRKVRGHPAVAVFKPAGVPKSGLDEIVLTLDEFETIRLADYEGLYQDDAAALMDVSRQTLGNILIEAHRKIADCLVNGKALRIEGGAVDLYGRVLECGGCSRRWSGPEGDEEPGNCPACGSGNLDELVIERGRSGGHGKGCGCGCGGRGRGGRHF